MKKIIMSALICLTSFMLFAQQDPLYSQYMFSPFVINPAYAGMSKDLSAMALYRQQWAGFEGAPLTIGAFGHIALSGNRMGLGLSAVQDKIGNDRNTQITAAYAYHLPIDDGKRLSFGLRGGVNNYSLDYSSLTIDRTDPRFQQTISEFSPVIGAGLIYSTSRMFFGISVPNLLKTTEQTGEAGTVLYNQHFYAQGAVVVPLTPRLKLKPFLLAGGAANAPLNLDVGALLSADDSYTIGVFTRKLHTYGVVARLHLGETLRVGYVFELPTNRSVGINFATHEFGIGIRMATLRSHDLLSVSDF